MCTFHSLTAGEGCRADLLTRAAFPIAEVVKCRPTDRLMGTRGAVLPDAEGGIANLIGGATQARRGTGINIGSADLAARGARAIAEVVDVGASNRLSSPG